MSINTLPTINMTHNNYDKMVTGIPLSVSSPCNPSLMGRSVANQGSCFAWKEHKLLIDAGCHLDYVSWVPRHIFLTHTHSDHVQNLPAYVFVPGRTSPVTIYLPISSQSVVERFLSTYHDMIQDDEYLEKTKESTTSSYYVLQPLEPYQTIQLNAHLNVQTIPCTHRKACLGYSFFAYERQIKPEYQGMLGRDIGKLRKEGVEVHQDAPRHICAYLGDTTHQAFLDTPWILKMHTKVVVECTFWDDEDIERAKETQHMHWKDLRPWVKQYPTVAFYIIHVSARYKIDRMVQKYCSDLENIFLVRQKELDNKKEYHESVINRTQSKRC